MALFAIPNPTKKVTIDFSKEQIKTAILRIPVANEKYRFNSKNDMFNQYTLEAFEFLSLGVYVDFNLTSISDTKTEIAIEVKRKIGAFDQTYEVANANAHIDKLVEIMSNVISDTDTEFDTKYAVTIAKNKKELAEKELFDKTPWYKTKILVSVGIISLIIWPVALVFFYGLYKRFN